MKALSYFVLSRTITKNKWRLPREFSMMLLGIIISVTVVTTAINLFEGYQRSLKKVLLDSSAHLYVYSQEGSFLSDEEALRVSSTLTRQPEVQAVNPVYTNSAMVRMHNKVRGCLTKAYIPDDSEKWFTRYIQKGNGQLGNNGIIIGSRLAKDLSLNVGDSLALLYPQTDKLAPMGLIPYQHTYQITGLVNTGYFEMDRSLIIMSIQDAQSLYSGIFGYSYLEVNLKSSWINKAAKLAERYSKLLKGQYTIQSWIDYNGNLFSLISMEKWLIFIVFCSLVLLAAINAISTVSTSIFERRKEIALWKTLGLPEREIRKLVYMRVFILCGIAILIGMLLGLFMAWLITQQQFYQLKGEVYFIDKITMHASLLNYLVVLTSSLLITGLCIRIPLKHINSMQIVEILRGS